MTELKKQRVPDSIYWLAGYFVFVGGLSLYLLYSFKFKLSLLSYYFFIVGFINIITGIGLFRLKKWARWFGIILFASIIGLRIYKLFYGVKAIHIFNCVFALWGIWYLTLNTTRHIFHSSRKATYTLVEFSLYFSELIFLILWMFLLLSLKPYLSFLPPIAIVVIGLVIYLLLLGSLENKYRKWLEKLIRRKPGNLSSEDWKIFKEIESLRDQKDFSGALQATEGLKDDNLKIILKIILKQSNENNKLFYSFIYNDYFSPGTEEQEQFEKELLNKEIASIYDEWKFFYESALSEMQKEYSIISEELRVILENSLSSSFINIEYTFPEGIEKLLGNFSTIDDFYIFIIHRLWETDSYEAAVKIAEKSNNRHLIEATRICYQFNRLDYLPPEESEDDETENDKEFLEIFILSPYMCEMGGLLYLNSSFHEHFKLDNLKERLKMRYELIDFMIGFREKFIGEFSTTENWLLKILSGYEAKWYKGHKAFMKWWGKNGDTQKEYYRRIEETLEIAQKDDFEKAAEKSQEAFEEYPESKILAFNAGYLLFENGRFNEALQVFDSVLKIDPDNIHALGFSAECYRIAGDYENSLKMYNKLFEEGCIDPLIVSRLALTLADAGFNENAEELVDHMLGDNPDPEILDEIADFFKENKAYMVSYSYRRKAFYGKLDKFEDMEEIE